MSEKLSAYSDLSMPDRMSEAMVATAAAYFFSGDLRGTEGPEHFRRTMRNMYEGWPHEARAVLVAGLMAAGFVVETDPLLIDTPGDVPEMALDTRLFMFNSYNVGPTIIDMGLQVASADSPHFNEKIVQRAIEAQAVA